MIYFCVDELNISPDVGLGVVGFPVVETVDACVVVVVPLTITLRFQYSIGFHFSS